MQKAESRGKKAQTASRDQRAKLKNEKAESRVQRPGVSIESKKR
jgi:hypothetical protein